MCGINDNVQRELLCVELMITFKGIAMCGINDKVQRELLCVDIALFVWFVALHPKSTDMVMAGRSVRLITLFSGQA